MVTFICTEMRNRPCTLDECGVARHRSNRPDGQLPAPECRNADQCGWQVGVCERPRCNDGDVLVERETCRCDGTQWFCTEELCPPQECNPGETRPATVTPVRGDGMALYPTRL